MQDLHRPQGSLRESNGLREFLSALSPWGPGEVCRQRGLDRRVDGSFTPVNRQAQLERFTASDGRSGCLTELLARYGLKIAGAPPLERRPFAPATLPRNRASGAMSSCGFFTEQWTLSLNNMDAAKAE